VVVLGLGLEPVLALEPALVLALEPALVLEPGLVEHRHLVQTPRSRLAP